MELVDLCLLRYNKEAGPMPCFAIVATLSNGKTNKDGRKQFMGAIRHKDPLLCTMGAFAQYFFHRWHCTRERPPNLASRNTWYRAKALVGLEPAVELSYSTQVVESIRAFKLAGVESTQKKHVFQGEGARHAELNGITEDQVSPTS
jgi:hypothetical protein